MKPDEAHGSPGSDAFEVLGWGLRRYWWLVLLSVVVVRSSGTGPADR